MSQDIHDILQELRKYKRTPESRGLKLRLHFADIVIQHLKLKGWTQRDLAHKTGVKESFISRIVHSDANCTLDTVGKILHALGVHARIAETRTDETQVDVPIVEPVAGLTVLHLLTSGGERTRVPQQEISYHGKEHAHPKAASTGKGKLAFSATSETCEPIQAYADPG